MDTQLIISIAQIITGIATFFVAIALVYQLRQQHKDAKRELVLAINEQRQNLAIALADNPKLSDLSESALKAILKNEELFYYRNSRG